MTFSSERIVKLQGQNQTKLSKFSIVNGAEATSAAGRLSSSSMTLLLLLLDGIALESRACGMAGTKVCLKVWSAEITSIPLVC